MDNISKEKLFEIGDTFMWDNKECHVIDVIHIKEVGLVSGMIPEKCYYYKYNYGPTDTEGPGMINNLVVSIYNLKKLE